MSAAAKSPAELIADLTDQVRLLRQDVGNLTATATTKAEAAKLMARIEKASEEAFAHAQEVIDASKHLGRRMHQDSASAAVACDKLVILGAPDHMGCADLAREAGRSLFAVGRVPVVIHAPQVVGPRRHAERGIAHDYGAEPCGMLLPD